jgi:hypothetical protein
MYRKWSPPKTKTKSKSKSFEKKGAAIVIWYQEKDHICILTGRESLYLRERNRLFPPPDNNIIKQHETILYTNMESAQTFFKTKAIELEIIHLNALKDNQFDDLSSEVRYDTPIIKDKQISVNYRFSNNGCSFGIIKGNKEKEDTDTKQTILRETREELGFPLEEKKIQRLASITCSDYDSFHYQINEKEKEKILKTIQARKEDKSGELFDLSFQKMDEKFLKYLMKPSWNSKSICAIQNFAQKDKRSTMGGRSNFTQKMNRLRYHIKTKSK